MSERFPRKLAALSPFRVRDILLVSTPYDAFMIEEDGPLFERLWAEFMKRDLTAPPRLTHARTGEEALAQLGKRRFDLVLTMARLSDMELSRFAREKAKVAPDVPLVLLASDITRTGGEEEARRPEGVDDLFLWRGDARILVPIIHLVEDRRNVEHDVALAGVRVIIVAEDSAAFASTLLVAVYEELARQAAALFAEGANVGERILATQTRPKMLHATSYEAAWALYERYRANVLAVISDIAMPRGGRVDPRAGFALAEAVRETDPLVPMLLTSSETENEAEADRARLHFVDKNSPRFAEALREFMLEELGFGDFVFRTPDGQVVGRARELRRLAGVIEKMPDESIVFHARRNHFSNWLMARSEFALAERLRPRRIEEFADAAELRRFLVETLRAARTAASAGVIMDYSPEDFSRHRFVRLSSGSIGGKARGLAFLNQMLAERGDDVFGGLTVRLPQTFALGIETYDEFLAANHLHDLVDDPPDDDEIAKRFYRASLPADLRRRLLAIVEAIERPIAVRSSSLLEDSLYHPFAGVYLTHVVPNAGASAPRRAAALEGAIRLVYASALSQHARDYYEASGLSGERERMGIVIQPLVGRARGERFYPTASGVAQSFNHYSTGRQKPEEGAANIALGLGRLVMEGGAGLRFSPRHPDALVEFASPEAIVERTQREFYAVDLAAKIKRREDFDRIVRRFALEAAEADGVLPLVGGVYDADDRRIRADFSRAGARVVDFENILRHRAIPLADALCELLELARRGTGTDVEIEFAMEMGDFGRMTPPGEERRPPILYLTQLRPQAAAPGLDDIGARLPARERCVVASDAALGHGVLRDIGDVIFVDPVAWSAGAHKEIAKELGALNDDLASENRPYILIGPGRWGSRDPWLGIPVRFREISMARVIVEASPAGYDVEPSQGTHFFQNLVALKIGYLFLPPGTGPDNDASNRLDWPWLLEQTPLKRTPHLRSLRFESPLKVTLDGRARRGFVEKT